MASWALLLLFTSSVVLVACENQCGPDKYETEGTCCQKCPPGHYVSKPCRKDPRDGECAVCPPDTFRAHPSPFRYCQHCTQCGKRQEMVADCNATSDRKCQCAAGYFCAQEHCEDCDTCSSCLRGHTPIQPCNATSDTVCSLDTDTVVAVFLSVAVPLLLLWICFSCCYYCKRRGISIKHLLTYLRKEMPRETEGPASDNSSCQSQEALLSQNKGGNPAAPDVEPTLPEDICSGFEPENRPHRDLSEEPGQGTELQEVLTEGGLEVPEPDPAAVDRPQGHPKAMVGIEDLEEVGRLPGGYRGEYFLKVSTQDGTNRSYFEFENEVPQTEWKPLMRLVGLKELEVQLCEQENPADLREQRHQMLLKAGNKFGWEASLFKLMAALHSLELNMTLENIINRLVNSNILGRYE